MFFFFFFFFFNYYILFIKAFELPPISVRNLNPSKYTHFPSFFDNIDRNINSENYKKILSCLYEELKEKVCNVKNLSYFFLVHDISTYVTKTNTNTI
jgi:hypothetical protein